MKPGTIQIDRAGRVVLPKPLRDLFNLSSGAKLNVSVDGNGFRLEPVRAGAELELKGSVLLFTGNFAEPLTSATVNQLIDQDRDSKPKRKASKRRGK